MNLKTKVTVRAVFGALVIAACIPVYMALASGAFAWIANSTGLSSDTQFEQIAGSSDLSKLVAIDYPLGLGTSYLLLSSNGGATWATSTAPTLSGSAAWISVASSQDGSKLAAAVNRGYIYTSTTTGATWATSTSSGIRNWYSLAESSDGTKIIAGTNDPLHTYQNVDGDVYTSLDSGATWATTSTALVPQQIKSVAMSPNGNYIVVAGVTYVYISTDGGTTWATSTVSLANIPHAAYVSSNGQVIVITVQGGATSISNDGGATWSSQDLGFYVFEVAGSRDGSTLVLGNDNQRQVWISTDAGANFTEQSDLDTLAGSASPQAPSISADGLKLVVGSIAGATYTGTYSPVTGCGTMFQTVGNTTYAVRCGVRTVYSVNPPAPYNPAVTASAAGGGQGSAGSSSASSTSNEAPAAGSASASASSTVPTVSTSTMPNIVATTSAPFLVDMKKGDQGADVLRLQQFLAGLKLLTVTPTGFFGNMTKMAAVLFQKAHGLPGTGFVGPLTRQYINTH